MSIPRYIAVEGVIGVGKSSLTRLLTKEFDARPCFEPVVENPFLAKFYSDRKRYAFQTHDKLYLVMDFQQGGELFFHLKKLGRFNQRAVQFYAAQMVLALEAIHKLDVIYRDLVRPACPAPAETGCCFLPRH